MYVSVTCLYNRRVRPSSQRVKVPPTRPRLLHLVAPKPQRRQTRHREEDVQKHILRKHGTQTTQVFNLLAKNVTHARLRGVPVKRFGAKLNNRNGRKHDQIDVELMNKVEQNTASVSNRPYVRN